MELPITRKGNIETVEGKGQFQSPLKQKKYGN